MAKATIAVFGAGAWGTALGIHLANNGHPTLMWSNEPKVLAGIAFAKSNDRYLPGIQFPPNLRVTSHLQELAEIPNWLLVIPSHAFTQVLSQAWEVNPKPDHILWATKGLCSETGELLHQAARAVVGETQGLAAISGPSFAREVAEGMPTAVTLAASVPSEAEFWSQCFASKLFSVYTSTDLIGVQIGGAVKNVVALAAGMSDGLGYGANARCALITRGLAEMTQLAARMGADPKTVTGLSGVGDLILTCTDDQSRNRRCGYRLGQGETLAEIKQSIGQVVEGVTAAEQVSRLAASLDLHMPVTEMMLAILHEKMTAIEAFTELFSQQPMPE